MGPSDSPRSHYGPYQKREAHVITEPGYLHYTKMSDQIHILKDNFRDIQFFRNYNRDYWTKFFNGVPFEISVIIDGVLNFECFFSVKSGNLDLCFSPITGPFLLFEYRDLQDMI